MKHIGIVALTIVIVILLTSVLLYAGDEKSVKKEISKTTQVQAQKPCQDKHAKGECTGHDPAKCHHEKGSAACKEKHAKGECKDHDPSKCQHDKCSAECKEKCAKAECKGHDKPPN